VLISGKFDGMILGSIYSHVSAWQQ